MCGIVAYLGKKTAQPILIEGLKRLEYRGYDSAGVALLGSGAIKIKKTSGRISALEEILDEPKGNDVLGIGHTRWATHGKPNTVNAPVWEVESIRKAVKSDLEAYLLICVS